MLKDGEDKKVTSEYEWFKEHEKEYLDKQTLGYRLEKKKNKDWVYWLVAFIVTFSFVGFTVNRMSQSAGEVKESQEISRMTAKEGVDHLYDEDGEWIRRNLTVNEYEQVEEKVKELEESSDKVHIKVRLDEAKEQLDSQEEAKRLVNELKNENGEANIDLKESVIEEKEGDFPSNYNPEYAKELELEYKELVIVIKESYKVQEEVIMMGSQTDKYIDGNQLKVLVEKVEGLPKSERKEKLLRDIRVLQDLYEEQQEEIRKREEIEAQRRKEEAERQQRIEAEKEAQRQRELEEERKRQEILEEQRREKEEQERLEQERREEVIKEQERLEQERIEQEEELKEQETEEQEQQEESEEERNTNNQEEQ